MDRETLMQEVKNVYASISQQETQQYFSQANSTVNSVNPEKYYEDILNMVLNEISAGTFDRFQSGRAIIDAVSNDKRKWLPQWNESIEG